MLLNKTVITIAILMAIATSLDSSEHYSSITSSRFGFTVRVPSKWSVKEVDLGYKYLVICSRDRHTEIVISATEQDLNSVEKWNNWEDWYVQGKGYWIRRIVETKNLALGGDMVGKLMIFEHREKHGPILDRVLITKFSESMVTIECRAPVSTYHRYSEIFTAVMGSLKRVGPAVK